MVRQYLVGHGGVLGAKVAYHSIIAPGLAVKVVQTREYDEKGLTIGEHLNRLKADQPHALSMVVRTTSKEPERFQVTFYLEDIAPLLTQMVDQTRGVE